MKKIIVYSDAEILGGHEFQFINAINKLRINFDLYFIVNNKCDKFQSVLEELNLVYVSINNTPSKYELITRFFKLNLIGTIIKIIKNERPDAVIVLQGNIERCGAAVIATNLCNVKLISYIPITHFLMQVSRHKKIGLFKDMANLLNYNLCRNYITINKYNYDLIKKRCLFSNIRIVNNGIDFCKLSENLLDTRNEVSAYNVSEKKVLIIGRIEFLHKGQDLVLDMIDKYSDFLSNYKFIFCGSGLDSSNLKKRIVKYNNIVHFEHVDNVAAMYSECDFVLIPSRFEAGEGSPMTLLEALYFNKKVLISRLPGVESYVNTEFTFDVGDIDAMYKCLTQTGVQTSKKSYVLKMHDKDRMANDFLNSVRDLCG